MSLDKDAVSNASVSCAILFSCFFKVIHNPDNVNIFLLIATKFSKFHNFTKSLHILKGHIENDIRLILSLSGGKEEALFLLFDKTTLLHKSMKVGSVSRILEVNVSKVFTVLFLVILGNIRILFELGKLDKVFFHCVYVKSLAFDSKHVLQDKALTRTSTTSGDNNLIESRISLGLVAYKQGTFFKKFKKGFHM